MKVLIRMYDKSKYEADSKIIHEEERECDSVWVRKYPKEFMAENYGTYEEELDENDTYCEICKLDDCGNVIKSTFANSKVDVYELRN